MVSTLLKGGFSFTDWKTEAQKVEVTVRGPTARKSQSWDSNSQPGSSALSPYKCSPILPLIPRRSSLEVIVSSPRIWVSAQANLCSQTRIILVFIKAPAPRVEFPLGVIRHLFIHSLLAGRTGFPTQDSAGSSCLVVPLSFPV